MLISQYLWLLLCYAQYARSSLAEDRTITAYTSLKPEKYVALPHELGVDPSSGCICRASRKYDVVVCFGSYNCRRFPKVNIRSNKLGVRTTIIEEIQDQDLKTFYYLKSLHIEANHRLRHLAPGTFQDLKALEELSISYNTKLHSISTNTFQGLTSLKNLTLVNNGFNNLIDLIPAFAVNILPSLTALDVSENAFEKLTEHSFKPMLGSGLEILNIHLCSLDYVHPDSFLALKHLKELYVGENELNITMIGDFLTKIISNNITLRVLDLSGLGFRKQPPRSLMNIIANSTINTLNLGNNQFEIITDDCFPLMPNIEVINLRKVLAISISPNTFNPQHFPNLKVLLLGNNNLPGVHCKHFSTQLLVLDMSNNHGNPENPLIFEIDKDTFEHTVELKVLNLSFNIIKSIFDYSFKGLHNLRNLNLESGSIFFIGHNTFKSTKRLKTLNLANNPLAQSENLTGAQFNGLIELEVLILTNCGIKSFNDEDIFEMMPNLTHLILKDNRLCYITPETIKPLKVLQVLDLSDNLLVTWWKPLFFSSGVIPRELYLTNNKVSLFSPGMIQDLSLLLENGEKNNRSIVIDLDHNVFICDCNSMYKTYLWLEINGTKTLKDFFVDSKFLCSSPELWEDKRVAEYLSSIKSIQCMMYAKISNVMMLVWTIPSIVTLTLVVLTVASVYKYRIYIRYWLFLAKLALGRRFLHKTTNSGGDTKIYKFDAFVSYCNEDSEFVSDMVSNLEETPPFFKLCVYERDFEIGSFISDSILTSINESRYVILIISNNFAKSQWCRWETQLAEYHRLFLEDGSTHDPLILVRLGDVENKHLTATLKYLLKTKVYLLWDRNMADVFWGKLRNVLIKRDNK